MHLPDSTPHAGSGVVRIDPLRFLAGCRTRRLNQVYKFMFYILACFIVLLVIRAPFYVLLVFVAMCSVFWLFWLSCHYLPSDWLERLLWRSLSWRGIVSRKPRPKSAYDFLGLLYCFIVLLCSCVVSCPYVIYYPTVMARYSLFVLKVPLNAKQTNIILSLTRQNKHQNDNDKGKLTEHVGFTVGLIFLTAVLCYKVQK